MSGGVDSAVAAHLLWSRGHDCRGIYLVVGPASDPADAAIAADRLHIPFEVLDLRDRFQGCVIDSFIDEYGRGRTPNPCVRCNATFKFAELLRHADARGVPWVATGHYARVEHADAGPILRRGASPARDQSYMLSRLTPAMLGRCLFPLGAIPDKRQVRELAAELGLVQHDKPDSQEICFIPDDDYRRVVYEARPDWRRPGDIVTEDGRVVGSHEGTAGYTIGQRRGLRVAAGVPMYVTRIDPGRNTVTIGPRDALAAAGLVASEVNWLVPPPPVGERRRVGVQIRYQHRAAASELTLRDDGRVAVRFDEPQDAVTPGQAAVFYDGEQVHGSGWIDAPLD